MKSRHHISCISQGYRPVLQFCRFYIYQGDKDKFDDQIDQFDNVVNLGRSGNSNDAIFKQTQDYIIDNNGSLEELYAELESIISKIKG